MTNNSDYSECSVSNDEYSGEYFQPTDWQARLEAAVSDTLRKRQAARDERLQLKARRNAGLRRRHAAKLARLDTNTPESDQP